MKPPPFRLIFAKTLDEAPDIAKILPVIEEAILELRRRNRLRVVRRSEPWQRNERGQSGAGRRKPYGGTHEKLQ